MGVLFTFSGCKDIEKLIEAIDSAIAKIERESDQWQEHLKDLKQDVNDLDLKGDLIEVEQQINSDITTMLSGSIGLATVGVQCNVDFAVENVIRNLKKIKLKLLLGNSKTPIARLEIFEKYPDLKDVDIPLPRVCFSNLSQVDLSIIQKEIVWYGRDFVFYEDTSGVMQKNVKVYLEGGGNRKTEITQHVSFVSPYVASLNLDAVIRNHMKDKIKNPYCDGRIVLESADKYRHEIGIICEPSPPPLVDNNLSIRYRIKFLNNTWTPWQTNGVYAGKGGRSWTFDVIEIQLLNSSKTNLVAEAHWQGQGDFGPTKGKSLRLGTPGKRFEALRLSLEGPGRSHYYLKYRGHVEGIGNVPYMVAPNWLGIRERSTRLEAVGILLEKK